MGWRVHGACMVCGTCTVYTARSRTKTGCAAITILTTATLTMAPRGDAPLLLYLLWLYSLWHQEGMRRLVCSYARSGSSVVLLPSTSLPPSSSPAVAPADADAAPPSPDAPTPTAPPAALAAPTSPGSPRLSASDKGLASDSAQPLELVASRLPSCGGESSGGFSGEVKRASGVKSAERRETPAKGQG